MNRQISEQNFSSSVNFYRFVSFHRYEPSHSWNRFFLGAVNIKENGNSKFNYYFSAGDKDGKII